MTREDWLALRRPVFALIGVMALGIAAHFYTDARLEAARQAVQQQTRTLRAAQTRLHKSGEEKELIVRHLAAYRRLAESGFIGDERRMAWLDALRVANESVGLFGVDYHIAAQRPYAYAAELSAPELVLQESTMKVRLRLLHEEDLLRFFSTLGQQNAGIFALDQCMIQRLDTGDNLTYRPHLTAECEVSWLTAKPASEDVKR